MEEHQEEFLEKFLKKFLEKCQGIIREEILEQVSVKICGVIFNGIPRNYIGKYLKEHMEEFPQ